MTDLGDLDLDFLRQFEGAHRLLGYVPASPGGRSGVTISTGVDLGFRDPSDLARYGLAADLVERLRPYCGVRGIAARAMLDRRPLRINALESHAIERAVMAERFAAMLRELDRSLVRDPRLYRPAVLTVVFSVAYQYGSLTRTPRFLAQVTSGDWSAALRNLGAFGDDFGTRRRTEGAYLRGALVALGVSLAG